MLRPIFMLFLLIAVAQSGVAQSPRAATNGSAADEGPTYTADGQLKMPERYREWIFLSSGVDMSYSPGAAMAGHSIFDNVFVNPASYRAFQKTGTWPDRTTLVLERRAATGASSINKNGHTQSPEIVGMELHVKDARLEGGWGFYDFTGSGSAKLIKRPADCYQCHEGHGAVDTSFVQFYPTLLGVAKAKGTLSPAYLREIVVPGAAGGK
ncbi:MULTISPECIES: cytochrome P460 family protein [Acidobacteriaceae]|uniref:cytochrome P460 family protein n=1 Tax=Acidobacteriaceae TaxID=204434 RepID=UPI00131B04C3|nr:MULTISPECIES: cytochrome P460 family protein [Acidobacteriaceae]MDW5267253.1 cytochrome P460 family protein [Edaphobacter sp.]